MVHSNQFNSKDENIYLRKYFNTWMIKIWFWQLFNWLVIEQNEGKLNSLLPIFNGLLILNEFILVNSIIADDVVIETVWPMLKFADNLSINLLVISDVILFKP